MSVDKTLKHIATLGPVGYLPVAPGTFGTLAALVLYMFFQPSLLSQAIILLIIFPSGVISAHVAERVLKEKDSGHIIIDEVCGYFVSILFIPFSVINALAAFFLFRFFDILKPFPIRKIENTLKGGWGIECDDIMAGVYTNIVLQLWILIK
jgi:phosphatidylglycerophosphatase A